MSKPDTMLWLDDHRGVYIPRDFANSFANRDHDVSGVDPEQWKILETGPELENEFYWEVWTEVCDNAIVTDENGIKYRLHQDGALWLVPEGMEYDEFSETFGWPKED
jgi:hypothetical protein